MLKRYSLALLAITAIAVPAFAQNLNVELQGEQGRRAQFSVGADQTANTRGQLDRHIAECLLLGNQEEVALAQFAASRSQNEQVKQFAQTLMRDHQQMITQLQRYAPHAAMGALGANASGQQTGRAQPSGNQQGQQTVTGKDPASPPSDRVAGARDPAQRQGILQRGAGAPVERRAASRDPNAMMGRGVDAQLFAFQKRAAEECLALTQAELSQKQGADFDRCYVGQQMGAHIGMIAKIKAGQEFASSELQQILQEGQQTAQRHLDEAKRLASELEGASNQ